MSVRFTLVLSGALLTVALVGCRKRSRKPEPEPHAHHEEPHAEEPHTEAPPPVNCEHADKAHHWIYYPDEPLYFCDRHQHHWVCEPGDRWVHYGSEYQDRRPNYAAIILSNETGHDIYHDYDRHCADYPPGSRR
jgi:hypothetical protein